MFFLFRLDDHLVAIHQYPKKTFTCDICHKTYSIKPSLLRHRALAHGEFRKFPCENCPKVSNPKVSTT